MTAYNLADRNKRRTYVLLFLFVFFVLILGWIFGEGYGTGPAGIVMAAGIAITMNLIAYFAGDKIALATAHARFIEKKDNPYVYRIVENLCITAGVPTPKIYIITDPALNAFTTGRNPEHASLALTTGIIETLENEELEGVVAHELSHIKNRDILVSTLVVILVGTVALLADIFLRIRIGGRRGSTGLVIVLAGVILAILSPLIAKLIQFAISREREFLADASGVLLTRYPEGLARALEKIAQQSQPLATANHATAHLFLEDPFAKRNKQGSIVHHLFSTHPPIEERIKRLRSAA